MSKFNSPRRHGVTEKSRTSTKDTVVKNDSTIKVISRALLVLRVQSRFAFLRDSVSPW